MTENKKPHLAPMPCPKFEWCNAHLPGIDDPNFHSKDMPFGIVFAFDENTGDTYINWMPDWSEWVMKPGEVYDELRDLETTLGGLDHYFREFQEEVAK